jgi:hypothetical protein
MNTILRLVLGTCLMFALPAAFACDYPDRPHIPDGATATKDELLASKSDVQAYLAAVDDYLRCVEADERAKVAAIDNPTPEDVKEHDEALSKKFDAANEEKALVGEQFNQQVRAFNKRAQEKSKDEDSGAADETKKSEEADESNESGDSE